jgi:signal recognition particle GTPase
MCFPGNEMVPKVQNSTVCVQIVGMLPMFSNMNLGKGMDKETQTRFRKYETIMDSMRDSELDESDVRKLYDINKMRRIARGSGSTLVCSISST